MVESLTLNNRRVVNDETLSKYTFRPKSWCSQYAYNDQKISPTRAFYNYAQSDNQSDKPSMCRIADIAKFNKIKHEYKLMDESGPAHRKQFVVALVLKPDQVFYGYGQSIKKAQQEAANAALMGCTLPRPPDSRPKKIKKDPHDPIVILNRFALHFGFVVNYTELHSSMVVQPIQLSARISWNNRGEIFPCPFDKRFSHMPPRLPLSDVSGFRLPAQPFTIPFAPPPVNQYFVPIFQIRLTMNGELPGFVASGNSWNEAQRKAALMALETIKPTLLRLNNASADIEDRSFGQNEVDQKRIAELRKNQTALSDVRSTANNISTDGKNCDTQQIAGNDTISDSKALQLSESTNSSLSEAPAISRVSKQKSPISRVHEYALLLKMNVEFEVLSVEGPAHDRYYVLRCKLTASSGSIVADGEGRSKKVAKKCACTLMLEKLEATGLGCSSIYVVSTLLKSQKRTMVCRNSRRKVIIKDKKLDPEYGQHINPVSRLLQIMQAKGQTDLRFQLIADRGFSSGGRIAKLGYVMLSYRTLMLQVTCGELRCEGVGPNKKLAKRAAAETMLNKIGFVKPTPQPGKSLLKKRCMEDSESDEKRSVLVQELSEIDAKKLSDASIHKKAELATINAYEKNKVVARDETESDEKVNEVSMSVTASVGSQVMTFAGIDEIPKAEEQRNILTVEEPSEQLAVDERSRSYTVKESTRSEKPMKRVTFSNEVSACLPPEDGEYPLAYISQLKSEANVTTKLRKRKDSKKVLTEAEERLVGSSALAFIAVWNPMKKSFNLPQRNSLFASGVKDVCDSVTTLSLNSTLYPPSIDNSAKFLRSETAYQCLERIAGKVKFSVQYSDFPKVENSSDSHYFSLVSLGIDTPLVCHGNGSSQEEAHNNAAHSALAKLVNNYIAKYVAKENVSAELYQTV